MLQNSQELIHARKFSESQRGNREELNLNTVDRIGQPSCSRPNLLRLRCAFCCTFSRSLSCFADTKHPHEAFEKESPSGDVFCHEDMTDGVERTSKS